MSEQAVTIFLDMNVE